MIKKLWLSIFTGLLLFSGCASKPTTPQPPADSKPTATPTEQEENTPLNEPIEITFFDVGQADSTLIRAGDEVTLIDAGNNADGELLVTLLEAKGITHINYLIGTHPHEDHIGGMDDIIRNFDIQSVMLPEFIANTKTFEDVLDAIEAKNLEIIVPEVGDKFGKKAEFTVLGPTRTYEDANNNSIVLQLTANTTNILFTGDMEAEAEVDLLNQWKGTDLKADILKLGHHGSTTSSTNEFLSAIAPKLAVIHVGEGNSYGHPHQETLDKLQTIQCEVLRTDLQGEITFEILSDGTYRWETQKNEQIEQPQEPEKDTTGETAGLPVLDDEPIFMTTYIGNINTKKFHRESCGSLPDEKNRVYFETRDDAINRNYVPCKKCNP